MKGMTGCMAHLLQKGARLDAVDKVCRGRCGGGGVEGGGGK